MVRSTNNVYTGEFQHTLDGKNRVTIPAKWRPSKDDASGGKAQFVLIPNPTGYIGVYPESKIAELYQKSDELSMADPKKRLALRKISRITETIVCDSQGRITLTEKLLEHAGISKDCTLTGMFASFEIWNPERYEQQLDDSFDVEMDDSFSATLRELGL